MFIWGNVCGQSPSFQTYLNPVIPGDHPDPTLTKIGEYFYTSGSSFNPTPKIYRSADLVHWEVIAQPVSASWPQYGDDPGGGIWGGHMVLYNSTYWHFFGRGGGSMYFVTAGRPEGPWSNPTRMLVPAGLWSLGVDNSIFIDEDTGKWYLLTKAGQENNHIVELGKNGQPTGVVLDLTWLNPNADGNPYGWAEGPVMWKYKGSYYYSFAEHLAGAQYVMRSDTLTGDQASWTIMGSNIFTGNPGTYNRPNHISPVVLLADSTSWTVAHSYHSSASWYAHGRQGLLCQVKYTTQGFPYIQFPPGVAVKAPALPSRGVPWMVPKSDMFNASTLDPCWSFLGYTPGATHSLTAREGWLTLEPYNGSNAVIQNDGEHSYSLITRVDFSPESAADEAGLFIINGPETHEAKVFSTTNNEGTAVLAFSYLTTSYMAENTIGSTVWLRLLRNEHTISGFYSSDGSGWTRIGEPIYAPGLDLEQTQFNKFTGNQQGLYVKGKPASFDLYIYRDAYSDIIAKDPASGSGVYPAGNYLGSISHDDWALYAGVEFGEEISPADSVMVDSATDYRKIPDQLEVVAASASSGGTIEVWLDSIETGRKIAELLIENTGGWTSNRTFYSACEEVSGRHDVYLRFTGTGTGELFRVERFKFAAEPPVTSVSGRAREEEPAIFALHQNYPNPFNPSSAIDFYLARTENVSIEIFNSNGQKIMNLIEETLPAGNHSVRFEGNDLPSGIYFYKMTAGRFTESRKMNLQ